MYLNDFADTGLDDSEMDDNPVKRRKPGRPKRIDKDGNLCFTGEWAMNK